MAEIITETFFEEGFSLPAFYCITLTIVLQGDYLACYK